MIRNYFRIALRNLSRNKVSSFINIVGLAAGMAVVMLIGLYVLDEYSYDRFHKNGNHIFRVVETQKQADGFHPVATTPAPLAAALKTDFAEVVQTARVGRWNGMLQNGTQSVEPKDMTIVDKSFFQIFDFPFILGNAPTSFDNPDEIIINEEMAAFFFGENWRKKDILGQLLVLNDFQKLPLKLVGVVKTLPANSHLQSAVFLPFKYLEKYDEWSNKWNSNNYHTYLQLKPEANLGAFGQKIAGYLKKFDTSGETTLQLQPLSTIYLQSKFDFQTDWGKRSDIFYVYLCITVGLTILLIAVFNFINLATARATQRAKEVGVRKLVGAKRLNLVYQFLTEALLTVGIAIVLAMALADLLLPVLNHIADKTLSIPFSRALFWGVAVVFVLVMTILSGLYPAFILSSFRPIKVMNGFFAIRSGKVFRQSLVVGQFLLSITLITSTLVMYRQLIFIQDKKLGFDKEQLLYVKLKGDLKAKSALLKQAFSNISGVASVSATTNNLVDVINSSPIEWEGQVSKAEFLITQMNVDADFLTTTGATLVAGRNFSNSIVSDTLDQQGAFLVNETAAQQMGWTSQKAVGKKVKFWGLEGNIIGVLADFHFRPLSVQIEPFILRYRPKEFYFTLLLKIQPSQVKQTIENLTNVYNKYEANYPFEYGFVNQDLDLQYSREQRIGTVFLSFSLLAIFISCLGLFGLAVFTAEQRTKEIGIRKVLGASIGDIVAVLSKDFIKLVLLAAVIAFPLAWYFMSKWLQDFAYRTKIEWWMFAVAGFGALAIALLTVSFQAIRAAVANPVESLRSE